VVVGPGGLYCISTKSHRGLFVGTADGLLHNGQPTPFARQAMRQTMDLRNRLQAMMGNDVPWVQAVLALSFGYVERDACGGKVWLVHQENVLKRLAPENGATKLSKGQIARTVKVLEMMQDGAASVYDRPPQSAPKSVSPR
jgi:hypothetical protein